MPHLPLQDLTGQVRKTETYYFANGSLADIWKGEWSRRISTKQMVRNIFIPFLSKQTTNLLFQVAIKVIRDVSNNVDYFELLKMAS